MGKQEVGIRKIKLQEGLGSTQRAWQGPVKGSASNAECRN